MSVPSPSATTITCVYAPAAFPSTVATAARRPNATPRLMTKSTLGPGITISANAVAANAKRESVGTTSGEDTAVV